MCQRKRYIKNSLGKEILVNCGHCAACLQEKAIARTNRIRNTYCENFVPLFITLTYKSEFLPYIDLSELVDINNFYETKVNIYRDNSIFLYMDDGLYKTRTIHKKVILNTIIPPKIKCTDLDKFVAAKGFNDFNHISVPFYKDFQDFLKRLKINLTRNYDIPNNFLYFTVNEIGPVTSRSHFHVVLFADKETFVFAKWKDAIYKSWLFSDLSEWSKSVQIAKDVSSYISSYVNSYSDTPELFRLCKEISPKHSYSKNFGISQKIFSLPEVFQMFRRRDLHYDSQRITKQCTNVVNILIPKYVISRYCPQFKGFSRLTCNTLQSIVLRPVKIYEVSEMLALEKEDCYRIEVMLYNRISFALKCGLSIFDFAEMYSQIWSLRALQVIKDNLLSVKLHHEYFQLYDNIEDLYNSKVRNETLEDLMFLLPSNFKYEVDYNNFDFNRSKDLILRKSFYSYKKDRKVRNYVLGISNNV